MTTDATARPGAKPDPPLAGGTAPPEGAAPGVRAPGVGAGPRRLTRRQRDRRARLARHHEREIPELRRVGLVERGNTQWRRLLRDPALSVEPVDRDRRRVHGNAHHDRDGMLPALIGTSVPSGVVIEKW